MITVVSGIPRSGTSMMMRMLEKGGMPVLTDTVRKPDAHNPHGYYEYEKVKSLQRDRQWIAEADGKAIKIIAQLLQFLPVEFEYRIIFMERPVQETVRSQQKMLGRSVESDPGLILKLCSTFEDQIRRIKVMIAGRKKMQVIFIPFAEVMHRPAEVSEMVNDFLGDGLQVSNMILAVDPDLWHERSGKK